MHFSEVKTRLAKLDTASLADANKRIRVLDSGIRPIRLGLQMIGRAHTVRCKNDFLSVIRGLSESVEGDVLVIDTGGSQTAVAGELFATEAGRRGLAGIVIDGACRDTSRIRTIPIPVYSRSVTPLAGTTQRLFETQIPIQCGGVTVHPGDILLGDDDGIVVASEEELIEMIPMAEAIQEKEARILKRMESGESLLNMLNYDEHVRRIKAGEESKLDFIL